MAANVGSRNLRDLPLTRISGTSKTSRRRLVARLIYDIEKAFARGEVATLVIVDVVSEVI